jgi:MFS family permease
VASGEEGVVSEPEPRLLDRSRLLPLTGAVVVMTVVAVEAMAVATVMPTVAEALDGIHYYSWAFTAYLLADVVGMVDAGRRVDRQGPRSALLGGLAIFAAGLVVASAATGIAMFLVGRVLQGLGGGSIIVALYVLIARAFPEQLRPKVFALLSTAWVVPALVGPAVAGLVTDTLGWRWVFAGIAPLALGGTLLLVPVLRALEAREGPDHPAARRSDGLLLAVALGLLQLSAQVLDWRSAPLAAAGLLVGARPLRRLLPSGTLRFATGLPTVIALRGLLACAFFGAEAYLPLTLAEVHGGSARVVGIPLTLAALTWSAGSWLQGRRDANRAALLPIGFAVVALGVGSLVVVDAAGSSLWLAVPIWAVAGAGMGIALTLVAVLSLELSPEHEQGVNSAALQISDITGSIVGIAVAGAVITGFGVHRLSTGAVVADLALAAVAVAGIAASRRAGLA